MSAIQIAQNTLGGKIPLSKEFFEKLTTKYPDRMPSVEELMADEDLMVSPVKIPQKKKSVQKEDRLGEYNPEHCDARIWAAKKGAGSHVGYDNVQCSSKKADGTCFCKRHNKKIGEFGSWWLGSIPEPRPENPIGPPGSKDPTPHFWSTDEEGNEVNRKKTKKSPKKVKKVKKEEKSPEDMDLEELKALLKVKEVEEEAKESSDGSETEDMVEDEPVKAVAVKEDEPVKAVAVKEDEPVEEVTVKEDEPVEEESDEEGEQKEIIFEGVDYLLDESDNTVIDAEDFGMVGTWNSELEEIDFEDDDAEKKHKSRCS